MAAKGKFFAVGKPQWQIACGLGLRPAVALIVMACGSGHDNATTTWSRKAIEDHTGMTWRRAHDAQAALIDAGILTVLKGGARPVHKLRHPECGEGLIWLPTELVTGAGDETPPVARLRQAGDLDLLQLLVELYFEQELVGDGGLPRSMVRGEFQRSRVCGHGPFEVFGFTAGQSCSEKKGPLARYFPKGAEPNAWARLNELIELGLLERVDYLAESEDHDAELIHALSGDEHATAVIDAANALMSDLPGGFKYQADRFDYALPIFAHMKLATAVGVYRLRYRPKTQRTAAWYARHVKSCREFEELYQRLAAGEFAHAANAA